MNEGTARLFGTPEVRAPARPKLALSTSCVFPRNVESAFSMARELGYDGLEVVVSADSASRSSDTLHRLADTYEKPVLAVHAPCLVISQGFWPGGPWRRLLRAGSLAGSLGAEVVVVHPPFAWQRQYAERFVASTWQLYLDTGITIAVENMYPWPTERIGLPGHALHWDPTRYDYPQFTLDLSHTSASGTDPLAMLGRMGRRLAHVHLSDGVRRGWDEHLVPGRGSQPCATVIEHLAASGYNGIITHEIRPPWPPNRRLMHAALSEALSFTRAHVSTRSWG